MIEAQIVYSKLTAVSREMGERFQRITRSPLIAEDHAFATAVMTNRMQPAVQHQVEAGHLFALKESTAALFDYFSFDIAEGDILVSADPYHGGSQAQTITMAAPLFYEGELVLFPVIRAQMADMSGEYPGGFHPGAFEVWQESIRLSPVKLFKEGVKQQDLWRFLLANSRAPSILEADLTAMHACLQTAQRQLLEFLEQHSLQQVDDHLQEMFQYSRQQMLREAPVTMDKPGTSTVSFQGLEEPLSIAVRVERCEGIFHLDFSGTSPETNAPYNMTGAAAKAFAVWPFVASIQEEININEGLLSAFSFTLPERSIVSPELPAATAFSSVVSGHFVAEAVTAACNEDGKENLASIHGPGPQVVLFPPIGTKREMEPLFFTPGYPTAAGSQGPPVLLGGRQLVSAEELENYHGLRMLQREMDKAGGMTVTIKNENAEVSMNVLLPEGVEQAFGNVELAGDETVQYTRSVAEKRFGAGERLTFHYPGRKGEQ